MVWYKIKFGFWIVHAVVKVIVILGGGILFYYMLLVLLWKQQYLGAVSFLMICAISYLMAHLFSKLLPKDFGVILLPGKPMEVTK